MTRVTLTAVTPQQIVWRIGPGFWGRFSHAYTGVPATMTHPTDRGR